MHGRGSMYPRVVASLDFQTIDKKASSREARCMKCGGKSMRLPRHPLTGDRLKVTDGKHSGRCEGAGVDRSVVSRDESKVGQNMTSATLLALKGRRIASTQPGLGGL